MVPFGELFNHRNPPDVVWFFEEEEGKQGFFIKALRNVDKGSQMYDSYGKKSNTDLLLAYGFIQPGNTVENPVRLNLTAKTGDPIFELKRDIMGDEISQLKLRVSSQISSKYGKNALSILRILMFDMNENFEQLSSIKELYQRDKFVPPLSMRNELMAMQELSKLC